MKDVAPPPPTQPRPSQTLGTADDLRQGLRKSRNQLKGRQAAPDALAQGHSTTRHVTLRSTPCVSTYWPHGQDSAQFVGQADAQIARCFNAWWA